MRTIRVAIGSDGGNAVIEGHFGEAKLFLIYDLGEDGTQRLVERRANTSLGERGHHELEEKRKAVLGLLADCQLLVAGRMSPSFARLRDQAPVQPVISEVESVPELLVALAVEFERLYGLCQARARGDRPREIPVIAQEAVRGA